jgi:hypothetical protein
MVSCTELNNVYCSFYLDEKNKNKKKLHVTQAALNWMEGVNQERTIKTMATKKI